MQRIDSTANRDERRWLPFAWSRGRLLWVSLVAQMILSMAWAFSPSVGSELLVTDESSSTLIGFGILKDDGLVLELSSDADRWRVVFVRPDGESTTYAARWDGERVVFASPDGESWDVADVLGEAGRRLTLTWWDGTRKDVRSDRFVVSSEEATPDVAADAPAAGDADDAVAASASNRPSDGERSSTAGRDDSSRSDNRDEASSSGEDESVEDAGDATGNRDGDPASDDSDAPADVGDETDAPNSNR